MNVNIDSNIYLIETLICSEEQRENVTEAWLTVFKSKKKEQELTPKQAAYKDLLTELNKKKTKKDYLANIDVIRTKGNWTKPLRNKALSQAWKNYNKAVRTEEGNNVTMQKESLSEACYNDILELVEMYLNN